MFTENIEEIKKADRAASIPSGTYEADITEVRTKKANPGQGFDSWIVVFSVVGGDYDGCEYVNFVTHSSKAAGVRAGFYSKIGYVVPEDGNVDENDFIGLPASIKIENQGGNPQIVRNGIQRSARYAAPEGSEQNDANEDAAF